jgi:hypothetical protein
VQIVQSVRTLQGLLDTLLDYSRLDGQVFRIDLQPARAHDILHDIQAEFEASAAEKGLDLRLHINDCWLLTDRALLHRILLNLVSNAIRHTRRGKILIACRHGATHARIEVWDTGPGIATAQQQAIFEELVQLDNPERDASKGLGLGLSIVRRIADLLAHPIGLKSRLGKGSCFSVTIPLASPPPAAAHDAADHAAASAPVLLLGADELDDIAATLAGWDIAYVRADSCEDVEAFANAQALPAVLVCTTGGDIAVCLARLDRLDRALGARLPALLIHPGPHPAVDTGSNRRLMLARPFRPARLRALLDFLLDPDD